MRASDCDFDPWGWPPMLLSDVGALAASASEFILGVTVLASVSSVLQASVCSSRQISLAGGFLGVSQCPCPSGLVDCLFKGHLSDVVAAEGVSDFSQEGCTCNRSCIAHVSCNHACKWMNVIEKTL